MADIDPEAVKAAHEGHWQSGFVCLGGRKNTDRPDNHCEPYRLAEALAAVVNLHTGLHRCIVDGVAADYLYCPTARAIGLATPDPYLRSSDA